MNLLKSQVQRQQQIEQVSKNVMNNGLPVAISNIDSMQSPAKSSPIKKGDPKKMAASSSFAGGDA